MRRPSRRWHDRPGLAALVGLVSLLATDAHGAGPGADKSADLARYDARIKAEDREHWAFRPVGDPPVPAVKNPAWVRNPIDAFVLAELEAKGWSPAAPAGASELLRRVTLDLIGLPPTPEERRAFLDDPSPEALGRRVDELLARPSYGERWGRHWLDLVRYAETNGYERDTTKPNAWRYRDYVIRAFNDDKPFDRFLREQLAGDELPDAGIEARIATGYYRLGPWDDEPADPKQDRFDQLDDIVGTTSEVFLGLTLGCARCHDHKFEPISALDYYRMVAIFNPMERPVKGRDERDLPLGSPGQVAALADRDRRIEAIGRRIADRRASWRSSLLQLGRSTLPAEAVEALLAEPARRTEAQKTLVVEHGKALEAEVTATLPPEDKGAILADEAEIRRLRDATPDLPRGYVLHEPTPIPPRTHLLLRGQATSPGPEVEPGVPAVLVPSQPAFPPPAPGSATSGRRLSLARWLSAPENPLTARVIVNRVWQEHFGAGIVRTPSDFGTMGDPPTHPELLDWLARRFVAEGWSIKALHRLILASNTYRMGRRGDPRYASEDPEVRLLWRTPYRRLDVEAIRDSMLAVAGNLNPAMFGPSVYPFVPREAIESHSDPDKVWKPFDEPAASRRTIYAFVKRSLVVPMIEVLDFCDTSRSSPRRNVTSVAPQALTLLNGDFVNRQSRHFANRLVGEVGDDPAKQVGRAFLLALCRPPTPGERTAMLRFLEREARDLVADSAASGDPIDPGTARRRALEHLCRVVFNSNEFAYTD